MSLEPPDHIDDDAKIEFKKLCELMGETIEATDVYILADFCQSLSDIRTLMSVVKVEGNLVRNEETGTTKLNPNVALLVQMRKENANLRRHLGLTPAARKQKLRIPKTNEKRGRMKDLL